MHHVCAFHLPAHIDLSVLYSVDECHKLKNHKSKTTKALHMLPSMIRFGLTVRVHEPAQACLKIFFRALRCRIDMQSVFSLRVEIESLTVECRFWTLLDWACPAQLGSRSDWKHCVEEPLKAAQTSTASMRTLAIGRVSFHFAQ